MTSGHRDPLADALLGGRPARKRLTVGPCAPTVFAAAATAAVFLVLVREAASPTSAFVATTEDYTDVGMQCASEFNWNQGQEATYKSATGYFVGAGGGIERSDIPDCSGSWTAQDDVLTLKGNKQPRMFLKDRRDQLVMLDMSTEEVSWTQNVAQLGKDFNGALYATWVRSEDEGSPPEAARLYCDANDGTGNNLWCPEMDLGEANYCGFRATSHPVTDLNANNWRSDAVNCYVPPGADQDANLFYCGLGIDGAQSLGSPPTQTWVDHYGNALWFTSAAAHPPCSGSTPDSTACSYGGGQTIDTDRDFELWVSSPGSGTEGAESGGSGLSWLSGATCNVSNGKSAGFPAISDAAYTIKNLRITNSLTRAERRVLFRVQK